MPAATRLMRKVASLRLTLVLIALLAAGTIAALRFEDARNWPMVVPLALLALNLVAAIATNGVFRRQAPLLVFHLALVTLLLLVAAGRLTRLSGYVGITDGTAFDGTLASSEQGPLHDIRALASVTFINNGFSIAYAPGLNRGPTNNLVSWPDPDGRWQHAAIGDQKPLVLAGYRFYTTYNKGFAPTFRWTPDAGPEIIGSVQLPPFPMKEYGQAAGWTTPGGTPVWVMLDIDETVLDPASHTEFRQPERYRLVLRTSSERHEMVPGDAIRLSGGTLRFDGLRNWMGYRVFYDWTLPWLLAACAVAVVSLGWHFWTRFSARPWDA